MKGCHIFKRTDGAFDSMPKSVREFQNYMSEFEYWALTIKISPQTCEEESQYPQLVVRPMMDYNRKSVDYSRISIN